MTICIHTGKACRCQPQEGVLCEFGPQPPYINGPTKLPQPIKLSQNIRLWDEAALHKLWAEAFEAGRSVRQAMHAPRDARKIREPSSIGCPGLQVPAEPIPACTSWLRHDCPPPTVEVVSPDPAMRAYREGDKIVLHRDDHTQPPTDWTTQTR